MDTLSVTKKAGRSKSGNKSVPSNTGWARKFKKSIPFYLMGLPAMIYIVINNYMPLYGLQIAFKDYRVIDGITGSAWCGLENFKFLFASDAWRITRNTVGYQFTWLILNTVISVFLAIFLNEIIGRRAKKFYQSMIMLPYLISFVIVAYIVYVFLSDTGLLNTFLRMIGLDPVSWYTEPKYWPIILTIVNSWKGVGFTTIIYLSTIVGFGKEYYEAAELDGAGKWKQITKVTIPMLKPTIIMMLTLGMGGIFRSDYSLFYQVSRNSGVLYDVTDTIDTYVFRALTSGNNMGMSSAAAFYQSVVCFVMVMIFNGIVRKISKEDAIF